MPKVVFQIEGGKPVTVDCNVGDNLLELARRANVAIDAPFSGNGSCGKCRIKLVEGELESYPSRHISDEEYAEGWRLSCSSKVVGNCTVFVPDIASAYQSRMKTADLSSPQEVAIFDACQSQLKQSGIHFTNQFRAVVVTMAEPSLDDTMPDNERLTWALEEALGVEKVEIPFCVMVKLAHVLRENSFHVCVKGELLGDTFRCMEVCAPEDTAIVGCAIDIGTTTVTGVLMDLKTGTLTAGEFSIRKVLPEEKRDEILRVASLCEQYSNHPISKTIRDAVPAPAGEAGEIMEVAGNGITAVVDGKKAAVGNRRLMEKCGVTLPEVDEAGTVLFVAVEGAYLGAIVIGDSPREGVPEMLSELHRKGVRRMVMLTGDNKASAEQCAEACGLTEFHAQLLPQDKVAHVEELLKEERGRGALVFVGDGVNDAPVLTMADVGIAMGGVGSDAAVEAADAVILNDDICKLPALLRIAKRTCLIAKENIVFALAVKGICLVLGACGIASVWMSVFADVGVAVIAILNALRAMRKS